HVESVALKLVETYSTGRGEEKRTREFVLGEVTKPVGVDLKPGETHDVEIELPFTVRKSMNDKLKEKGGALGALGKLSSLADAERSEFALKASADVRGTTFGPCDRFD